MLKKCDPKGLDKTAHCYFQSQSHCIFTEVFKGIKRASELKVDCVSMHQAFDTFLPDINLENLNNYCDNYFTKLDLDKVLGRYVISTEDVHEVMDRRIVKMTSVDRINAAEVKLTLVEVKAKAMKNVNSETPFNDWLLNTFLRLCQGNMFWNVEKTISKT